MQTPGTVTWNELVKKEARGTGDFSLGEIQAVGTEYVITEKGTVSKHKYFIPKYLVRGYDGHNVWFSITEPQAEAEFKRDTAPMTDAFNRYKPATGSISLDTVPLISKPT
jgi:hypothetical protein